MWSKTDGQWSRTNNIFTSDDFKPTLQRLQTYAKCLNASTYSVTNQLNDIYSIINYQHGFYIQILPSAPDVIKISGVVFNKSEKIYNLSITHSEDVIVNNVLELPYVPFFDENGIETLSIRTAIEIGYIKAANSLLFEDSCGFEYFNAYNAIDGVVYYDTIGGSCWSSGTSGTAGTAGNVYYYPNENNIMLSADYTAEDVYGVFNNNERNMGWSLSTIWTPEKLLNKLLNNFRLVDLASTTNVDLLTEWFELKIDEKTVNDKMLILLKDQTNAYENGVYKLVDRFLVRDNIFDGLNDLEYFSAYVKEGIVNKEKQFFLERTPSGEYPLTNFGTSGAPLFFVEGFNYAIRNRVDYKLLQNNTIRDSVILEENSPILLDYEKFNFSYDIEILGVMYNYKISAGGDFIERKNLSTDEIILIGLVDYSTTVDLTAVRLNALNVLRKDNFNNLSFINNENNTRVVYQFDPFTFVSTAIFSLINLYDFTIVNNVGYGLVDISSNNVKLSKIVVVDILTSTVIFEKSFDFFINELQVFINQQTSEVWYFFNTNDRVYLFSTIYGLTVLSPTEAKYLTLNINSLDIIIAGTDGTAGTSGTSGTSGSLENDLIISWIDQTTLRPVRYVKNIANLSDYSDYSPSAYIENGNIIDSEFVIKTDFSKVKSGDWEIKNDSLYLKDVNIINGTNGIAVIPKISNTIGRYFDGKDDFIQFNELQFNGISDFSIEFSIIPEVIINNVRAFQFITEPVNTLYSGFEFILLDIDTGFPKFQIVDGLNTLTVNCNTALTLDAKTRVTITIETSTTQNNLYIYTVRVWFNNTVVGTTSTTFGKIISDFGILNNSFLAKTSSLLDPRFRGEIREFRISNIVLNPAQIASRDREIITTDLTYGSLLYYWKLKDTVSIIKDETAHQDGLFNGGLALDPDLYLINTPTQMLFSSDNYMYFLSKNEDASTAGTSGIVYSDRLFRVDLRTEDLDMLYESTYYPIKSIYVENNLLYWLENDIVWQYNIGGNIIQTVITIPVDDIVDFTVVNDKIFYFNKTQQIFDENNNDVSSIGTVPVYTDVEYIYGLYQTFNNIFWYNVYFKLYTGDVKIISTTFTPIDSIIGDKFQNIAVYPFYDRSVYKKKVTSFGYNFAITENNTVVQITNDGVIDLDSTMTYWSYNVKSIFGISMSTFDLLYIASINNDDKVQIWRYNVLTSNIVLMQYSLDNTLFTAIADLDIIVTSDFSGKYLTIINSDYTTFRRYKISDIDLCSSSLELDIRSTNVVGKLYELQNIDLNNFYYTVYRDNLLWMGRVHRETDAKYWLKDIEYNYTANEIWAADFGVAFKKNYSTSGHSLDLLETLVKWNLRNIQMDVDKNINENNYIDPTWTGTIFIVGDQGGVLKSEDFAQTWRPISSDIPSRLNAISLKNSNESLIVGEDSTILQTFSGGQFFDRINVPLTLSFNREFTDVLIYNQTNALVVGKGGMIIHLILDEINNTWKISSNILNDQTLVTVTTADLESRIKPQLTQDAETNILLTNYTKIIQNSSNSFWLFGDRGLVTKMTLNFADNLIKPDFTFYQATNFNGSMTDAIKFTDYSDGLKKFIIAAGSNIYLFKENGSVQVEDSALRNVVFEVLQSLDYTATDVNYKFNYNQTPIISEELFIAGTLNNIKVEKIQEHNLDQLTYSSIRPLTLLPVDAILNDYFKPRMLFTDYYLARKINILLEENNWIVPTYNVDKSIFNCYKFLPGEYIEFANHDEFNNSNYLAIQDWYYTSRRIMLQDANGIAREGEVKVFPYNKRLTAVADMTNYKSSLNAADYISNPLIQNIDNYTSASFAVNFPELFKHTVISIPATTIVNANDVLNIRITRPEIDSNNLPYEKIIIDDVFIVKHVEAPIGNLKKIVLWDLLNDDILADAQLGLLYNLDAKYGLINSTAGADYDNYNIQTHNLNYFIADAAPDVQPLLALKDTLKKHLIGKVYDITIDVANILPIYASVNFENRYANLETVVTFGLYRADAGTSGSGVHIEELPFNIKYPNNTVYGPNYNILNFLTNLDPSLDAEYVLKNVPTFSASLNGLSGVNELSISRNLISAGSSYIPQLVKYLTGTWVDITLGDKQIKRVRIDRIELTTFTSGVDRIIIHTDTNLTSRFDGFTGNVLTIRPRTKLGEISKDLEFTDNINMPRPFNDGEYGTAGFVITSESMGSYRYGYYSYVQTATSYAIWLADDPIIKKNISAIIWLDKENDLRLNVYNWNKDPNFAFRPIDLYEVGIDFVLKRSITILDTNWDVDGNLFGLKNIDFTKFNFMLTDQLDLVKLNKYYPWVLNADVRNAVIGEEDYQITVTSDLTGISEIQTVKRLRWYTGTWYCGTWENGAWYNGSAYNIKWLRGDWYSQKVSNVYNIWKIDTAENESNSQWFSGIFGSGTWHNGTWFSGLWQSGTHIKGIWYGGTWLNGQWSDGTWTGGTWTDGIWLNGTFNSDNLFSIWLNGTWLGGDFENGTWSNGIWDQGAGKKSRFGTKATTVQPAIWEYGQWKNGEFHSFLNLNSNNQPIASAQYRASTWRNGIWEGGNWYGGTWERGLWKNGVWHYGLWRSLLDLDKIERVTITKIGHPSTVSTWLKFNKPHYIKETSIHVDFEDQSVLDNKLLNLVTVLGEPDVSSGDLPLLVKGDPLQDQQNGLGWNSFPIQHVVKIIDDMTLAIQYLPTGGSEYIGKNLVGETFFVNNNYLQIIVQTTGIQRITYSDLFNLNFSVGDPRLLQLFNNDIEIAINVQGQSDGEFNLIDYIEFYGQIGEQYYLVNNDNNVFGKRIVNYFELNLMNIPPQSLDMLGQSDFVFFINDFVNKSYVEISNAPAGVKLFDITDLTNVLSIGTTENITLNAIINNTAITRTIYASNFTITPLFGDQGINGTFGVSGSSGTSGECIDRNLILPPVPEIEVYEFVNVYLSGPRATSHWQDGTFKAGIWEFGYWNNGRWEGGIWIDGVFERGVFGA